MRKTIAYSALIVFTSFVGISFAGLKVVPLNYGGQNNAQLVSAKKVESTGKFSGYTRKPAGLSDACVWKILDAIQNNAKIKDYVAKDAMAQVDWTDENQKSVTVSVVDDGDDGNLTVDIAVKKLANKNCKPGKVINWDFSL